MVAQQRVTVRQSQEEPKPHSVRCCSICLGYAFLSSLAELCVASYRLDCHCVPM